MSAQETQDAHGEEPKGSVYQIYHNDLPGPFKIIGEELSLVGDVNANWDFTSLTLQTHDGQSTSFSIKIDDHTYREQQVHVTGNKEAAGLVLAAMEIMAEASGKEVRHLTYKI
ncbi:hypothetical protein IL306_008943 [Fusarium sp. DS 682]|nr:hypothetical protein IL306_008943 [Fusarium sp. DS 682]